MRSASATTLLLATLTATVLALGGCGDDVSSSSDTEPASSTGGDPTTGPTGPTNPTAGTGSTSTSTSTSADASGSDETSGGFVPTDPECGNGFVEADEQCDDGNDEDADGCNNTCQFQCGLDWSLVELAPTDQSQIDARGVAVDADGGAIVVAFSREITTDQKGNQTIADDEGLVVAVDAAGEARWSTRLFERGADVNVVGIASDADGDAYVAASVSVPGEDSDIAVYKVSGADGSPVWEHLYDSAVDNAEDFAFGIAVDAAGNPVVSGQVRVGEGDDDVFVRKLDGASGDEVWTSTWSGTPSGGFSTEDGGPVAVGSDGSVFVFAGEYVSFETQLATLIRFGADGGEAEATVSPQVDGGVQDYVPLTVAAGDDGTVAVTVLRFVPAGNEYLLVKLDGSSLDEEWRLDPPAFEDAANVEGASDYFFTDVTYVAGGGLVATGILDRNLTGTTVAESWIARVAGDSTLGCLYVQQGPQGALVPGALRGRAVEASPSGDAVLAAQQFDADVAALWIGAFRPQ